MKLMVGLLQYKTCLAIDSRFFLAGVIFIATNLAESSLTLPNVTYVIDTGLCKVLR
jgi:hypothetical protein